MKSINIPSSVTSIGSRAFFNCSNLAWVAIPTSVTSIGTDAFYCCISLTSISIPNSVTSLGEGAFRRCTYIQTIYNHIEQPIYYSNNLFYGLNIQDVILYVPKGSKDAYSTAPGWSNFVNIQEMDDNMTGINNIMYGNGGSSTYFSIDGKKTAYPQKGLNIIKTSDGSVNKVLVK